jgi:hypothetical protein
VGQAPARVDLTWLDLCRPYKRRVYKLLSLCVLLLLHSVSVWTSQPKLTHGEKEIKVSVKLFFWVSSVLFHPFFFLQCASDVLFPNHDWLVANNDSPQLRATLTFRVLSSFCTPHIHNESLPRLRSLIRDAAVSSSFPSFFFVAWFHHKCCHFVPPQIIRPDQRASPSSEFFVNEVNSNFEN